jgi:3-hydroxybutyrate dehydrogenase
MSLLRGRRALITGSTSGLGLIIAEHLAAQGCGLLINGLTSSDEADQIRRDLSTRHGVNVIFDGADLARPDEIAAMMQSAVAALGGLDILINNAVVRHFAPIEDMRIGDWERALAVNLSAAFHTIRLALPLMRQQQFGRIINIASVYSFMGALNRADYVTTKTGLVGLTRAVALETAGTDITCNAVAPGVLPTEAILGKIGAAAEKAGISVNEATHRYLSERQPGGQFIPMESVASLIITLCAESGRGITGTVLPVDGGWTIN